MFYADKAFNYIFCIRFTNDEIFILNHEVVSPIVSYFVKMVQIPINSVFCKRIADVYKQPRLDIMSRPNFCKVPIPFSNC